MFEAPPGNGPGWHTHSYVEMFVPLTGTWKFVYGTDADDPDGEVTEVLLRAVGRDLVPARPVAALRERLG